MRRAIVWLAVLALALAGVAWAATAPRRLPEAELAALPAGDAARGEALFWAGGCAACHAERRARGDDRLRLGGGQTLETPFGTFSVPNISPDPADGIGGWSDADFANAMLRGVAPDGRHYYPAFPYASYTRMRAAGRRRPLGVPAHAAAGRRPAARPRPRLPLVDPPRRRPLEAPAPRRAQRPPSTPPTRWSPAASISSRGRATAASATPRAT